MLPTLGLSRLHALIDRLMSVNDTYASATMLAGGPSFCRSLARFFFVFFCSSPSHSLDWPDGLDRSRQLAIQLSRLSRRPSRTGHCPCAPARPLARSTSKSPTCRHLAGSKVFASQTRSNRSSAGSEKSLPARGYPTGSDQLDGREALAVAASLSRKSAPPLGATVCARGRAQSLSARPSGASDHWHTTYGTRPLRRPMCQLLVLAIVVVVVILQHSRRKSSLSSKLF